MDKTTEAYKAINQVIKAITLASIIIKNENVKDMMNATIELLKSIQKL